MHLYGNIWLLNFCSLFPSYEFAACCWTWLWLLIRPNSHLYGTDTWHKTTNYTSLCSLLRTLCQGLGATYTNHMKGYSIPQDKRVKTTREKAKVNSILHCHVKKDVLDGRNFANPLSLWVLIPMDILALPSNESSNNPHVPLERIRNSITMVDLQITNDTCRLVMIRMLVILRLCTSLINHWFHIHLLVIIVLPLIELLFTFKWICMFTLVYPWIKKGNLLRHPGGGGAKKRTHACSPSKVMCHKIGSGTF